MNDIPLFHSLTTAAAQRRALAVLASGWLGYGPQCLALERRFAGANDGWALATNSCTSALYLCALLCRANQDDRDAPEVVVPTMTFISSAMAFAHAGYRVRVADVDPASLTLTAQTAAGLITARTRAIVVVHLYGQRAPDLAALRALADRHGVALIEDCAHRIDLADAAPRLGDYACFSFNAVKELPGGEAGMLWARDPALEARARAISNAGLGIDTMQRTARMQHRDYRFSDETGLKLRSNDIAAALVLGALDEWPAALLLRQRQFARYDELLAPFAPDVVPMRRDANDSFLMYVVRARRRGPLREALAARRIATSIHYPCLARHPHFAADADPRASDERIDGTIVTLPTALALTEESQQRVAAAIADAPGFRAGMIRAAD
ncbi:MAG: DegT/DnrJ/EryC1/StrS family aminotransferase [Betaproteobacteria bacterium]